MPTSRSRRRFLKEGALATLSAAAVLDAAVSAGAAAQASQTPGAPPVPSALPPVGPAVTPESFAEAEKLMQVSMTAAERAEATATWRSSIAPLLERRTGPRKIAFTDADVPATVWNPGIVTPPDQQDRSTGYPGAVRFSTPAASLPADDAAIAFASVLQLAHWVQTRQLTSERLARIYLARLKRYDPQLHCVITLTEEHALAQARAADAEIAAGKYRGPLHGIPFGAKDLLDTAGIATTYGAEPFRNRVPQADSAVIRKLNEAGAVLVAKLSLGSLALNDIWFGGQTKNPWLLEEGSSGSSAGPGAAVAAGLVAFAIGSETQGSIIGPSMRCGVTGLRPTFGRVPRTGAMTLCWSQDKLGPMARTVEDTIAVLQAIHGFDEGDNASIGASLAFDATAPVNQLRVGYLPRWMTEAPATAVDRHALDMLKQIGMRPVEVSLPDWPYDSLNVILLAEAAAAFEEITLDHRIDQLTMQTPDAWPNTFRQARFLSAVDFVQADRLRRKVAVEMARLMKEVDLLLVPSLRDEMLVIANFTGHPSLTLPAGFVEVSEVRSDWAPDPKRPLAKFATPRKVPHGVTLIGRLFDEGTMAQAGLALQKAFGMTDKHPNGFER